MKKEEKGWGMRRNEVSQQSEKAHIIDNFIIERISLA